jgi:hypothetical protein
LEDVLRQTVITRLRLAHPEVEPGARNPGDQHGGSAGQFVSGQVADFADKLRHDSQASVDRAVAWLIDRNAGLETLLLDLAPQVEQRLHAANAAETGDHADVTLALWRLQELVERLSLQYQDAATAPRHERRALLATAEPASYRLCLQVAAERLNHDGWDVSCDSETTLPDLAVIAAGDWIALVVIASERAPVDTLAGAIRTLRRASANPDLRVLVMSDALVKRPDRLVRLGADAAAADIRQASVQAARLLALMPSRL